MRTAVLGRRHMSAGPGSMFFLPLVAQPVPLPNTARELHVFFQELNQYGTAATALL